MLVAPYAPPRPNASDSEFPFEIDAALIAKEGSVRVTSTYLTRDVPYWNSTNKRLLYYGSISTRNIWTWLVSGGDNDGFSFNNTNYDYNLLYAPPPSFPVTSTYDILKWREILVTP